MPAVGLRHLSSPLLLDTGKWRWGSAAVPNTSFVDHSQTHTSIPLFLGRPLKPWGEAVTHCSSRCKTLNQAVPLQSWIFQQQNLESRMCCATSALNTPQRVLKLQFVGWKVIVSLWQTIPWGVYFSLLGILKDKMFVFVSGVHWFHKSRI